VTKQELKKRAKDFSYRCIRLAIALPKSTFGNHVRGQLIRCSSSVAANYRATLLSQSKASFISKLSIVVEEADESAFWLELIMDFELMKKSGVKELLKEANELTSIFVASRKTMSSYK